MSNHNINNICYNTLFQDKQKRKTKTKMTTWEEWDEMMKHKKKITGVPMCLGDAESDDSEKTI